LRPHLILLDLMMPEMDGIEFMATRDFDPTLATIPVVVISGDVSAAKKASQMGASSCLKKPVGLTDLLASIDRHVPRPGGEVSFRAG
jgi:CheY-like chemotaxis protein